MAKLTEQKLQCHTGEPSNLTSAKLIPVHSCHMHLYSTCTTQTGPSSSCPLVLNQKMDGPSSVLSMGLSSTLYEESKSILSVAVALVFLNVLKPEKGALEKAIWLEPESVAALSFVHCRQLFQYTTSCFTFKNTVECNLWKACSCYQQLINFISCSETGNNRSALQDGNLAHSHPCQHFVKSCVRPDNFVLQLIQMTRPEKQHILCWNCS